MEAFIVLGVISFLGYHVWRAGMREGSRKGYNVGRSRGRWRR